MFIAVVAIVYGFEAGMIFAIRVSLPRTVTSNIPTSFRVALTTVAPFVYLHFIL